MTTKIYTKKGDTGLTNLFDTRQIPKWYPIFDALGDLDEIGSHIGHLCSLVQKNPVYQIEDDNGNVVSIVADRNTGLSLGRVENPIHKNLRLIQVMLLNIGSDLSTKDKSKHLLKEEDVTRLEEMTDYYNEKCRKLTEFILLGSSQEDAIAHVCRSVCRRAERNMWRTTGIYEVPENCFKYVNRLSSFFFALARYMAGDDEVTRSMYSK